jgi:hypothetical protein
MEYGKLRESATANGRWLASAGLLLLLAAGCRPANAQGNDRAARAGAREARHASTPMKAGKAYKRAFIGLCRQSAQQLCKEAVAAGGDKPIARCLASKRAQLPPRCQAALRRAHKVASFRKACGGDVRQLCADAKANGERVVACLQQKQAEVSERCRERMIRRGKKGSAPDVAAVAGEAAVEAQAGAEPIDEELATVPEEPAAEEPAAEEEATPEPAPTP